MDLKKKKVLVVGLGKTGLASIRFLVSRGAKVVATDLKNSQALADSLDEIEGLKIRVELGNHRKDTFLANDLIVLSPGVSFSLDPIQKALGSGIEVISEIELAYRFLNKPIIAVTGTNGKTTTVTLIDRILNDSGRKAVLGGNIGQPLISFVDDMKNAEYIVAELSSFQLEGVRRFRAHIGILLNISEDHLDRHDTFRDYVEAKSRIFLNQQSGDYALLNADDPQVLGMKDQIRAKIGQFSHDNRVKIGTYLENNAIVYRGFGEEREEFSLKNIKQPGRQNIANFMAVVFVAKICGCPAEKIQKTIDEFPGLEHRMEFIRDIDQVTYYNDSKATNVGAVIPALNSFQDPVILIAGGKDKGLDFKPLKDLVQAKVKLLILLGEAKEKIFRVLGDLTRTCLVSDLKEAVALAKKEAQPKDVVLLSPGCASFDMFTGYEERGDYFKTLIRNIN